MEVLWDSMSPSTRPPYVHTYSLSPAPTLSTAHILLGYHILPKVSQLKGLL